MTDTLHNWKIVFRNDKMGFQKPFGVVATDHDNAIYEAISALQEEGYHYDDFAVISVQRIREVGT